MQELLEYSKEELKQEAEEKCVCTDEAMRIMYRIGYIDGAEPREKRIAELERQLAISEHDREHNDYELTEVYKKVEVLEKENAELKSENQKWKDEWQEQVQKATDEGYARTLQTMQLTKAKEIIHKVCYEYGIYDKDLMEEAKQFLNSEVEK